LIAADSSSLIAFLDGAGGEDVAKIDKALGDQVLVLPPPVISEMLARSASAEIAGLLAILPALPIADGVWERAGHARRALGAGGLKAKMAGALIAQCCIDAQVALITRDRDFRHFERLCGLTLA
jgi:predicted nucleic acid-binding protein